MLGLALFSRYLLKELYDLKVHIVSHIYSLEHLVIGDVICACLYHDDLLSHRCHGKLQISLIPVLL